MGEETIFATAAAKKTASERQAYLDEACAGNAELRAQVEDLLRADSDAGSFLDHPPAGLDATIAATASDTVNSSAGPLSLPFLAACDKPGRIGKLVGKAGEYEILEVVGQGGMGAVLRAFETKLSRVVAVKVMSPGLAANPRAVKRFLREATTAAAVHHDHVVTIHAVDETHQPPFLVMQFIEGQTLQQKIDREGALELKHILRIGSQAAAGLAAAHKTGLIHRDVKPANILLENGVERVKITDFGLARAADDLEITQTGMIAGTPQYMSPEQAKGEPIDTRSDLFSLGSVLYTMCTGRPAFRADNTVAVLRRVCDDAPRPIHEVNAEIPPWLEAIVNKLLAKDPADRFQTANEVAELLSQHLAHVQNPALVPPPAIVAVSQSAASEKERQPRTNLLRVRHPAVMAAAAVILLLIGLAITIFIKPAALDYVLNRATLVLDPNYAMTEMIVTHDGKEVAKLSGVWPPRVRLPAGTYSIDIKPQANRRISEVTVDWGQGKQAMSMPFYSTSGYPRTYQSGIQLGRGSRAVVGVVLVDEFSASGEGAAATSDNALIQGTWAAVSGETNGGQALPSNQLIHMQMIFKGDRVEVRVPKGQNGGEGTFQLDTAASPKRLKITRSEGPNRFAVMDGIFQLSGDRLRICMGEPEDKVTEFKSRAGTHILLAEFVRLVAAPGTIVLPSLPDPAGTNGQPPNSIYETVIPGLTTLGPAQARVVDLAKWGKFIDPRGECKLQRQPSRVTITVPGTRPFNLMMPEWNLDAPRLLEEVEGDFTIQVAVPHYERPVAGTSSRGAGKASYRGAALLVWIDEQNLLRWERSAWGETDNGAPFFHGEWCAAGVRTDMPEAPFGEPNAVAYLQIERRGSTLVLRSSFDGQSWQDHYTATDLKLPARVSVGLVAQNSTNTDFSPVFEQLAIATNRPATTAGSASSAVLWRPPEKPEPEIIFSEAQADARVKRYDVALAKHVWFHQNAEKYGQSLSVTRLYSALVAWKKLGDAYPPALVKLKETRDQAAANVRAEKQVLDSFQELTAINRILGEEAITRDAFVALNPKSRKDVNWLFRIARPALIRIKDYKLCLEYIDPAEWFAEAAANFHKSERLKDSAGKKQLAETTFVNRVATLVALLAVNGRKDEAETFASQAKKEWNSPVLGAALDTALQGTVPEQYPLLEFIFIPGILSGSAANPPAPKPAAAQPIPAALQALRDLVAAKERSLTTAQSLFKAAEVTRLQVLGAEVELVKARLRLAEAEQQQPAMIELLKNLVALRQEARLLTEKTVKAGGVPQDELNQADARLADAQARLAKVEIHAPPEK